MKAGIVIAVLLGLRCATPVRGEGDYGGLRDDDRYVRVLAGKAIVEGVGFPGLFGVGSAIREKYVLIGNGHEDLPAFTFWYFHEKGPWHLVIAGENDHLRGGYRVSIRAMYVEGEGAPPTAKGVKIGDPEAKVVAVYGEKSESFEGTIHGFGKPDETNDSGNAPDLSKREAIEASLAAGRYYPAISTIFAFEDGKVSKICVLRRFDPLALWLRPVPDSAKPQSVIIDPKARAPRVAGPTDASPGFLIVPAPPTLAPVKGSGFELRVPIGWTRTGDRWTAPEGLEFVDVRAFDAKADGDAQTWIDRALEALGRNDAWPPNDVPPPAFCASVGVAAAHAHLTFEPRKDPKDLGLRIYTLLLLQGDHGWQIRVARRAMADRESPDGVEFARQVLTSLRLAK